MNFEKKGDYAMYIIMFGQWIFKQTKRYHFFRVLTKKGKLTPFVRVVKRHSFNYERVKFHLYVPCNDEWFDFYYNPFTGEKKRVLDKNDFLYRE